MRDFTSAANDAERKRQAQLDKRWADRYAEIKRRSFELWARLFPGYAIPEYSDKTHRFIIGHENGRTIFLTLTKNGTGFEATEWIVDGPVPTSYGIVRSKADYQRKVIDRR